MYWATPDLNFFFVVFFSNSNNSGPISRSEAAKIIKDSKEKPVAKVKPMFRTTEEPVSNSPNLLGDILSRQNDFFKPIDRSNIVPKEPRKSEVKIIIYSIYSTHSGKYYSKTFFGHFKTCLFLGWPNPSQPNQPKRDNF